MTKSRRTKPLAAEFTIGVFLVLGIPKGRVFGREIRISVGTARYFSSRLGLLPKTKNREKKSSKASVSKPATQGVLNGILFDGSGIGPVDFTS